MNMFSNRKAVRAISFPALSLCLLAGAACAAPAPFSVPAGENIAGRAAATRAKSWKVVPLVQILQPIGIFVDPAGDVYFTEVPQHSVKALLTDGKLKSVDAHVLNAQGIAAYQKAIYVADTGHRLVKRVSPNGHLTLIGSGWNYPRAMNTDSAGNIYVFDEVGKIVRFRHDKETSEISTPSACVGVMNGLGMDEKRNLYITCGGVNQVYRLASDGTATELCSGWYAPNGITSDPAGDVFVGNNDGRYILECTASGKLQTISTDQKIGRVTGLYFRNGDLYVTCDLKDEIYKLVPPS